MLNHFIQVSLILWGSLNSCQQASAPKTERQTQEEIRPSVSSLRLGADRVDVYLPKLKSKKVAMVVNPTSQIGGKSSVDSLLSLGIHIVKVFGPEHGFRGEADAGSKVDNSIDSKTGLPVISLYGKNYKPKPDDLKDVDILVFDIQDVGTRFYTYISTLHYIMEACAENNKPLLVLDRPNPNGFSIDGPILDPAYKSFIGMHPIPITHGMTIGEYAQMINGEKWLNNGVQCALDVVNMENYRHDMEYILPIKPSPNLNTQQSILLYPSLCLFEGTIVSQGRGTRHPFTVLGAPALKGKYPFSFTPTSIPGMSTTPLHQDEACYGIDLRRFDTSIFRNGQINLSWLIELYKAYPRKQDFFDSSLSKQIGSFDKLAGTKILREQIVAGKSESEIRATWKTGLENFRKTREKYLLY